VERDPRMRWAARGYAMSGAYLYFKISVARGPESCSFEFSEVSRPS
jgi:hypothetical protein